MEEAFPKSERFEMISRLGSGGMGVVYEVFDREKQEKVALKTIETFDPQAVFRLKNEFRSLQDIEHKNLVSLGEMFEADGRWYFTMEFVDGVDFVRYVRGSTCIEGGVNENRFDEQRLRRVLLQLAEGLSVLHENGRVHRDIKPSNLLVQKEGRLVVLDFGLAMSMDPGEISLDEGGPLGTAAYMAPEQASSGKSGPEADWYSVGVVLYQALTGLLPFEGGFFDIILAKNTEEPPQPRQHAPEVPEDLDELCIKLMDRNPEKRPAGETVISILSASIRETKDATLYKTRAPVFSGREEELKILREAVACSMESPKAVLVYGSSGLGKSELIREFAKRVYEDREATVLFGRCYERESLPFKAFDGVVDSLSRALEKMDERDALAIVPRDAALLLRVFPVLGRVGVLEAQATPRRVIEDVQMVRTLAFDALRDLLARLADRHPVLVLIDDFQWADDDSLRLMRALLHPPESPAICLVLSVRTPADPDRAASVVENVKKAVPIELVEMPIKAFSYDSAVSLALKMFTKPMDENLLKRLAENIGRESEGHPFFIQELVRYAEEVGGADESVTLDQALEKRVAALDKQSRSILRFVCISGAPVRQDLIGNLMHSGMAGISQSVAQLRWMNLLRSQGPRPEDTVEPYNNRVREWVVRSLDAEVQRKCHLQLFHGLRAAGGAPPEKLALHLEEAGEHQKAALYTAEAAKTAEELLAFDRAADLYKKALNTGPEPETPEDIEEKRGLVVKLADALASAGRGGEAAEAYLEGTTGANAAQILKLEHQAASQLLMSGRLDEGLEIIEKVARRLGRSLPRTPFRALLSLLLRRSHIRIRGLRYTLMDPSRISPEELEQVDLWRSLAMGLGASDHMRAADFNTRWVINALNVGEPERIVRGLAGEAVFVASLGKRETKYFKKLEKTVNGLLEKHDSKVARAYLAAAKGWGSFMAGEWSDALDAFEGVEKLMPESTGAFHELTAFRFALVWSLFYLGEFKDMNGRIMLLSRMALERGDIFAASGLILGLSNVAILNREGPDGALREVNAMIAWWSTKGYHLQHYYALLARVHIALFSFSGLQARDLVERDRQALKKSLLLMIPAVANESLHLRARALLAAAAESDTSEQKPMLAHARKIARRLGRKKLPWMQALAMLLDAAINAQQEDVQSAVDRLRSAISALDAQRMKMYAAAARWRLAELIGGVEGDEYMKTAVDFMSEQNVSNMEGMMNLLAPGFRRKPGG